MVTLVPNPQQTGIFDLDSRPTGSEIWIDEHYYGLTPKIIDGLSAGSHTLVLRKTSYYDYTEKFTIVAGQTISESPAMTPSTTSSGYGDLQIQANPAGATVYLNNDYRGTTVSSSSLYFTQLAPGSYSVRVTLTGYQPYTETAVINAGEVYTIQANMVPVTSGMTPPTNGQIMVRLSPPGANIYLDNEYRGLTPFSLEEIPAGDHTLILKMSGYQDWQSSVNVPAGSNTGMTGTHSPSVTTNPPVNTPLGPTPTPTKSPVLVFNILFALVICGAGAVLWKKSK
jgi:hypothetical protein